MSGLDLFTFNAQIRDFTENVVPRRHVELQKEIAIKLFELLSVSNFEMPHHPHDTGLAQGNWRVAVNEKRDNILGSHESPPTPRSPAQVRYQLRGMKGFQKIWIYNNVPYMPELESGNSVMAPKGIVGPALTEIEVFIDSVRG